MKLPISITAWDVGTRNFLMSIWQKGGQLYDLFNKISLMSYSILMSYGKDCAMELLT